MLSIILLKTMAEVTSLLWLDSASDASADGRPIRRDCLSRLIGGLEGPAGQWTGVPGRVRGQPATPWTAPVCDDHICDNINVTQLVKTRMKAARSLIESHWAWCRGSRSSDLVFKILAFLWCFRAERLRAGEKWAQEKQDEQRERMGTTNCHW